jgi:type II secretory pathway component PulF
MPTRRLPLDSLIHLCRTLRHSLSAGMTVLDVLRRQAQKGPAALRPLASRVTAALEGGAGLEEALGREGDALPPLFLALARVGEQTGMLPEVCADLERYFLRQQKLRRDFRARVAWPLAQFVLAVLVLAGVIWIMGGLNRQPGRPAYDPLGLGLSGASGAAIFLGVVAGVVLGGWGLYVLLTRALRRRAAVDGFLLRLPLLGPCLRALALGRFCLALRLTTASAMPIRDALRLSFAATANAAFAERGVAAEEAVARGSSLIKALTRTGLFPEECRHILAVGEESGRLDEVLRQQAEHYDDEAGRRLATLTQALAWGVWLLVAVAILAGVFRLFGAYVRQIDQATGGV